MLPAVAAPRVAALSKKRQTTQRLKQTLNTHPSPTQKTNDRNPPPRSADAARRLVVGLVGYPNVGKSSTINAIFGAKKTAVAPTPGKTKHFQTLNVSPSLCLCDCPGLVLPRFAGSRAEMVAAGVVPIDRLTEVRPSVDVVAARCGRPQLESAYGLRLGPPGAPPPRAPQLLAALAAARGWAAGGGLPDEARAGRLILKDYTSGRLLHCQLPPGSRPAAWAPAVAPEKAADLESMPITAAPEEPAAAAVAAAAAAAKGKQQGSGGPSGAAAAADAVDAAEAAAAADLAAAAAAAAAAARAGEASSSGSGSGSSGAAAAADAAAAAAALAAAEADIDGGGGGGGALLLDPADLELLDGLSLAAGINPAAAAAAAAGQRKPKAARPEYKMHKKGPLRSKGARGQVKDDGGYDGAALKVGKKGGLVRVSGYAVSGAE